MISPINWLWNVRHTKLLEETKALIFLALFLRNEVGLKKDLSTKELRGMLSALKSKTEIDR